MKEDFSLESLCKGTWKNPKQRSLLLNNFSQCIHNILNVTLGHKVPYHIGVQFRANHTNSPATSFLMSIRTPGSRTHWYDNSFQHCSYLIFHLRTKVYSSGRWWIPMVGFWLEPLLKVSMTRSKMEVILNYCNRYIFVSPLIMCLSRVVFARENKGRQLLIFKWWFLKLELFSRLVEKVAQQTNAVLKL